MSEVEFEYLPEGNLAEMSSIQEGAEILKPGSEVSSSDEKNVDVLAALKDDHRKVEKLFEQFESTDDKRQKLALAKSVCKELTVHAAIEEELVYPILKEADEDGEEEAELEHELLKFMISQLEGISARDKTLEPKVKVLKELVEHHVEEEEDEMFPKLEKKSDELEAIAEEFAARKQQLMQKADRGAKVGSKAKPSRKAAAAKKPSRKIMPKRKSIAKKSGGTRKATGATAKKTSSARGVGGAKKTTAAKEPTAAKKPAVGKKSAARKKASTGRKTAGSKKSGTKGGAKKRK